MCTNYTTMMHARNKRKERAKEMDKGKGQAGSTARLAKHIDKDERYKLCPSCGNFADFLSSEIYCILCGTRLLDACPECHAPIHYPTAKFCPLCGGKYGTE